MRELILTTRDPVQPRIQSKQPHTSIQTDLQAETSQHKNQIHTQRSKINNNQNAPRKWRLKLD